jgi:excisionase family DNA binding protein
MTQRPKVAEVLTLEETARFLRVSRAAVKRLAERGAIPCQQVEGSWRFLKTALEDWLSPKSKKVRTAKDLLQYAGLFADDETLPQIVAAAYAARGQPVAEVGLDSWCITS